MKNYTDKDYAYTYMLLYLAELSITKGQESNKTLNEIFIEYNLNPQISLEKAELLIFLITIGNGQKSELLIDWKLFKVCNNRGFKPIKIPRIVTEFISINEESILTIKIEKFANLNFKTFNITDTETKEVNENIQNVLNFLNNTNIKDFIRKISISINHIYNYRIKPERNNNIGIANEDINTIIYRITTNDVYDKYHNIFSENGDFIDQKIDKVQKYLSLNMHILTYDFPLQPKPTIYNISEYNTFQKLIKKKLESLESTTA